MLTELQSKARQLVALRGVADVAAQRAMLSKLAADTAVAEYNLALAEECARRGLAPGMSIDVFGDGKVKPTPQCQLLPPPKEDV